jgi:hypothetical protein
MKGMLWEDKNLELSMGSKNLQIIFQNIAKECIFLPNIFGNESLNNISKF